MNDNERYIIYRTYAGCRAEWYSIPMHSGSLALSPSCRADVVEVIGRLCGFQTCSNYIFFKSHNNHVFNCLNLFDGCSKVTKAGNLRSFHDHFPATIFNYHDICAKSSRKKVKWSMQHRLDRS